MNKQRNTKQEEQVFTEYRKFIEQVNIRDIRLISSRIEVIDRDYYPSSAQANWTVDATYERTEEGFDVFHRYRVRIKDRESKENKARISVTFLVSYLSKVPITDELFDIFREHNLPINTWPYFREFVHNSLVRVGWPPFIAPVLVR